MGNGEKPSELHKLPLAHITDKACLAIMGDRITDTMMCAGDPNKAHGTCKVCFSLIADLSVFFRT